VKKPAHEEEQDEKSIEKKKSVKTAEGMFVDLMVPVAINNNTQA